jgi:hypothetical protein
MGSTSGDRPPDGIRRCRRLLDAGDEARMKTTRNIFGILMGQPPENANLED